jgi:hypothetical protein
VQYLVVQSRWIRDSEQNGENVVAKSTRKREARGLARSNFHSHMNMLITHKFHYRYDEYYIDEENLRISFADDDSIVYSMHYYVMEVE